MSASTSVLQARSKLGVATKRGETEAIAEARRDLAASKLEQYVQQIVDAAPPLLPEQRDRIAALLRPVESALQ